MVRPSHVAAIRGYVGDIEPPNLSYDALLKIGVFTKSVYSLQERMGTWFIGSTSPGGLHSLLFLASSLRTIGCLLIAPQVGKIAGLDVPGSAWLTVFCREEAETVLKDALSKVNGFELIEVGNRIFVILGAAGGNPLALALEIDRLRRRKRTALSGT